MKTQFNPVKKFLVILAPLAMPLMAVAATDQNSFTPTRLDMPIFSITLTTDYNGNGSGTKVYQCSGQTETDCMQNLLDPNLSSLISGSASPDAGTYNYINIGTCAPGGSGYHAYITGSVSLGAAPATYYTKASGSNPLSTTGPAEASPMSYTGCAQIYKLPTALTITSGSTPATITLFVNMTRIAYAELKGSGSSGFPPGGCTFGSSNTLCSAYLDVIPYVGDTNPGMETYYIKTQSSADNTAFGQVLLLTDPAAADAVIGGFTRRLYSESSTSHQSGFDTALQAGTGYSLNLDGISYRLENYGSSATGSGYLVFPNFERATHNSTATQQGSSLSYPATKQ